MPLDNMMQIPKTKSAEEFESMCVDILSHIYKRKFFLYGRKGQKQCGIDIISGNDSKELLVAQCKNYFLTNNSKSLIKKIKNDIMLANADMSKFDEILKIKYDFEIEIMFWDELQEVICEEKRILKKYYPIFIENENISTKDLNNAIVSLRSIIDQTKELNNLSTNYQVAQNEENDRNMYNKCVHIFISASELRNFTKIWHLQIKQLKIDKHIENIIDNIPDFYDEKSSGGAANLIATIDSYFIFFKNDENTEKINKNCERVIKTLEKDR